MPRTLPALAALAALAAGALAATAAAAAGDGTPYRGTTAQDRDIKLIVDGRGRVKRGSFSAATECGGRFKPFIGDFAFRAPLDRARRDRFRDQGSTVESDGTYSGRYKWDIKGKRRSGRRIAGRFSVEIVFRRDGNKYATCIARHVSYEVRSPRRG